ncbi:hypothetical protein HX793_00330 [Pseudomonas reactans]|nr:hypothetical protein [Pseudomonas reactans]NWD28200.1 hypothetical protein [Pseudomonas reactans]
MDPCPAPLENALKTIMGVALLATLLAGCAPSHSAWTGVRNAFVGTRFDAHLYDDCSRGCGDSYWSPVNKKKVYDQVVKEGDSQRYFVTWIRDCRYSVLVSGEGIIQSWRYENEDRSSCYIF